MQRHSASLLSTVVLTVFLSLLLFCLFVFLFSQVAKQIWICDNKTIQVHKGTIRDYKQGLIKKMKKNQQKK